MRLLLSGMTILLCAIVTAAPVKLSKDTAGNWQLIADGKPFRVRGIGRFDQLELAKQCGVNTLRTYDTADFKRALKEMDTAQQYGFKVIRGIWLQHENKKFSYKNPAHLEEQRKSVRRQVQALRHHPALLCWGLGNEAEGPRTKEHPEYWRELNVLAGIVKEEDPNHPIMNVIAGNAVSKIEAIKEFAPLIDIIGINAYAGAVISAKQLDKAGWKGPWMLTEFGPHGHWEVPKTDWGAPIEPDDKAKADNYEHGYRAAVADTRRCLGTIPFVWSNKQEITGTWFGMFLESGERTPAADKIARLYSGKPLPNQCPNIRRVICGLNRKKVAPCQTFQAQAFVTDPENDPVTYEWKVIRESGMKWAGGSPEPVPPIIEGCFPTGNTGREVTIITPGKPGAYRLFLFVRDGQGGGTSCNLPFLVEQNDKKKI